MATCLINDRAADRSYRRSPSTRWKTSGPWQDSGDRGDAGHPCRVAGETGASRQLPTEGLRFRSCFKDRGGQQLQRNAGATDRRPLGRRQGADPWRPPPRRYLGSLHADPVFAAAAQLGRRRQIGGSVRPY